MIEMLVAAGITLHGAGTAGPNIILKVEGATIDVVSCHIVNPSDTTTATRLRRLPNGIEWSCLPGDRLQCDAPALEPIDLEGGACSPTSRRLAFKPSAFTNLDFDGPAVVEWRAETPTATRLIATRQVVGPARLPIAAGGRILRVFRAQYSPVTIQAVANGDQRFDRPRNGGELFGRIQMKTINPITVQIDGPSEMEVPIDESGRFSAVGLLPGDYRAFPVYRGGVRGVARNLLVSAAQTTELFSLVKEPVGGVLIDVAPAMCGADDRMNVTRVQSQLRSATFERAIQKQLAEGCEFHLEGLKPGRYEATVHDRQHNDLKAAEDFVIEADQLARANVGEPRVVVEGRVTLGDKPGGHLLLAFERTNNSGRLWVTETNDDGSYHLQLDRPGNYSVEARAARHLGAQSLLARLQDGFNTFDVNLTESRLTVRLLRSDAKPIDEIVSVHIDGLGKAKSGFVMPKEGNVLEFAGIPLGNYVVTADTSSGLVSLAPANTTISKTNPEAEVTLTLASSIGELRLIAGDGSPIQGARVQVGARILEETQPGTFELKSVAPASHVVISAPGFVPMCHMLLAKDMHQTTVAMSRGTHAVEINFTPPIHAPIGEITGLPGSTCPVPLAFTSFVTTEDMTSTTLRIVGLPEGRFSYTPSRLIPPQIMEVPGPAMKFTKPKAQF